MQLKTIEICWHSKDPILSADWGAGKIVTGGADTDVKIWKVAFRENNAIGVTFLSNLSQHTKAVNVVRFSPNGQFVASAADDGRVIVWYLTDKPPDAPRIGDEDAVLNLESWAVHTSFRSHEDDIFDLAWSQDSLFLASVSVDRSTHIHYVSPRNKTELLQAGNLPYAYSDSQTIQRIKEHSLFVQGVAWDPRHLFLATMGSDRSLRVYASNLLSIKRRRVPTATVSNAPATPEKNEALNTHTHQPPPPSLQVCPDTPSACAQKQNESFVLTTPSKETNTTGLSSTTTTTPAPIAAPTALLEEISKPKKLSFKCIHTNVKISEAHPYKYFHDETLPSFFRRPAFSPDGNFLAAPAGIYLETNGSNSSASASPMVNTTYLFHRRDLSKPIAHLPSIGKPSVVVRFSPILYARQSTEDAYKTAHPVFASLAYKMVFAIATLDAVVLHDTQQLVPFAYITNIHFAPITDLAWKENGRALLVTSQDGYCTILAFDQDEIGAPLDPKAYPTFAKEDLLLLTQSTPKEPKTKPVSDPSSSLTKPKKKKITPTLIALAPALAPAAVVASVEEGVVATETKPPPAAPPPAAAKPEPKKRICPTLVSS